MKKYLFVLLAGLLIVSSVFTACSSTSQTTTSTSISTTLTTTSSTTTQVSTQANWWDKFGTPKYGGNITIVANPLNSDFDPYVPWNYFWFCSDTLFSQDWTLDRKVWSFQSGTFTPESVLKPGIAQSWEWNDPQTATVRLRQDVRWQNKAPANGREFTAQDVQFHYDRILGTGNGFTEPNPTIIGFVSGIQQVTAQDKYTVVFKFKEPSAFTNSQNLVEIFGQLFELPELVKSDGLKDWHNSVGNGPYMLTDFQPNASASFVKNPDYWGKDERHPQNKIPYIDQVKLLCITDQATAVAAYRTGKIDILQSLTWQQAAELKKSNPDSQQDLVINMGESVFMRTDRSPFTDIRVRQALNMAIDRSAINKTIYGGYADPTPQGAIYNKFDGWYFPYDQWSQQDKDLHSYNPAAAKKLLADAGYPNGFTTDVISVGLNTNLEQIIKAEFMDIGVDMAINAMEFNAGSQFLAAGKNDAMAFNMSNSPHQPNVTFSAFISHGPPFNYSHVSDPAFDAMYNSFMSAASIEEAKKISRQMDQYYIGQYWRIDLFPAAPTFTFTQPYIKGYSAEALHITDCFYWARLWTEQSTTAQ
jgi:peptide/nickel transport system substrate-binding protein